MANKNTLILTCGGTGSGKTTVAKLIRDEMSKDSSAQVICLDQFYLNDIDKIPRLKDELNYDHPNAFDWELIKSCINSLLTGKETYLPEYDYSIHQRKKEMRLVQSTDIIVLEGILSLYDKELCEMADIKIFVETESDERFIRRLVRDVQERGRSLDSVIKQWRNVVRPMHKAFVDPLKESADIIIPWYKTNMTGVKTIIATLSQMIKDKK